MPSSWTPTERFVAETQRVGDPATLPDLIKYDEAGLVPAIVQDAASGDVLMLAYMNRESLAITLKEGRTCFYSRSRRELWRKGETSGHVQRVRWLRIDCDGDTILVGVEQEGSACHNDTRSCFVRAWEETPRRS
jgi:phosphoribosyl-AMP cyclohydrolase